jgi:branched-chain amino acid transport system substrate-binding protein
MMHNFSRFLVAVLIMIGFLQACSSSSSLACSDPLGCIAIPANEPIRIGYILSLTGVAQSFGRDILNGVNLAIDDYQGQLLGHPLELYGEDADCSPEKIQKAAINLTLKMDFLAIIGPHCPTPMQAAALTFSNAGIISIPLMATTLSLVQDDQDIPPGIYGLTVDPFLQGEISANFAFFQLKSRRVALLKDNSVYSDTLADLFKVTYQNLGGTITYEGIIEPSNIDMHSTLSILQNYSAEALYFPIFERSADYLVLQRNDFPNLQGMALISSDELLVDSFFEHTGKFAKDVYLSGLELGSPDYPMFLEKWMAIYNQPPESTYHVISYDATHLLLASISNTAEMGSDGSLLIGRQSLRNAFSQIRDFPGLSGSITCMQSDLCTTNQQLGIFQPNSLEDFQTNWPPQPLWESSQINPDSY